MTSTATTWEEGCRREAKWEVTKHPLFLTSSIGLCQTPSGTTSADHSSHLPPTLAGLWQPFPGQFSLSGRGPLWSHMTRGVRGRDDNFEHTPVPVWSARHSERYNLLQSCHRYSGWTVYTQADWYATPLSGQAMEPLYWGTVQINKLGLWIYSIWRERRSNFSVYLVIKGVPPHLTILLTCSSWR